MNAQDIMTRDVVTIGPDMPVPDIAKLLVEKRISAVPVVADGKPIGIVSEGDLLLQAAPETQPRPSWLEIFFSKDTAAAEYIHAHARIASQVMTHKLVTVTAETPVAAIVEVLEKNRIKRVPVVDAAGRLVGIVSRANILHGLASRPAAPVAVDDVRIRDAYLVEMRKQSWADLPDEGNVIVDNGIVHLWGVVRLPEVRKAMVLAAQNIPGVKGVEDHMDRNRDPDAMTWANWPQPSRP
jgi:CBS domain-containing protein